MQLCSALQYLHEQIPPIIHGDIKPANIMLTPKGDICLIDFNISFFMNSGTVLGYTDGYTSPEQYQRVRNIKEGIRENFVKIDERADLYSLGQRCIILLQEKSLQRTRESRIGHF